MPAAMNALDCLVHPQVGTEALGLVVCEAHACGKPVIASALDGVPEAFAFGGLGQLVKPEAIDELAQAFVTWSAQPPLSLGERAQLHERVAANFSLSVPAKKTLALYRRLVGIPESPP
jgi:glycosyltransferase involved in cell wall biosynthesis